VEKQQAASSAAARFLYMVFLYMARMEKEIRRPGAACGTSF
jgi:hypothetical protein